MTEFKKEIEENKIRKIKINLKAINKLLYSTIICISIYYIGAVNDLTVKGFELQKLKKELISQQEENNENELQIMSMNSYGNLNNRVRELNMVAVNNVEYIKLSDSTMAKK